MTRGRGGWGHLELVASLLVMATAPVMLVVAMETLAEPEITVTSFTFMPGELTVAPGTTVVWINKDETPHTVISDDKTIRSGALDTGDQFTYRFTTPGVYAYHCSLHPQMTGTVIVR